MQSILEDLKKLKDIYTETVTFKLGKELKLTLKLLTSEEETEVHSFSAQYEKGLGYLYSVKRETILRSIITLNGNTIPDIIEDGVEKVQKHIWLRENVVKGWSQVLIDEIWNKYAELLTNLESKINLDLKEEVPADENGEKEV